MKKKNVDYLRKEKKKLKRPWGTFFFCLLIFTLISSNTEKQEKKELILGQINSFSFEDKDNNKKWRKQLRKLSNKYLIYKLAFYWIIISTLL